MTHIHPDFAGTVDTIFHNAPFVQWLGLEPILLEPGWCKTKLEVRPEMLQQDGVLHAGILGSIADHTAGAAATALLEKGQRVLTSEFKVNLLRPVQGARLECTANILKHGRTLHVAEADVWSVLEDDTILVAKALVTLVVQTVD